MPAGAQKGSTRMPRENLSGPGAGPAGLADPAEPPERRAAGSAGPEAEARGPESPGRDGPSTGCAGG